MFRNWRKNKNGFFDEFEKEFEDMNDIINNMMLGNEPIIYGFRAKVGPDGVTHVEHFGNRPVDTAQNVRPEQKIREPFTSSIIDEKNNELNITAEMPGIQKEDIEVNATENEVFIKAENGGRKYYTNVKTPSPVEPGSAGAKYNNGVLEVTLKLKEPCRSEGKKIKIE